MNVAPDLYDRTNFLQKRDAETIFREVVSDQVSGDIPTHLEVVVDVGCGTGNITRTFSRHMSYGKIVAFDVSREMIEYAKNNHYDPSIEYHQADLCGDWDVLKQQVISEESADAVISIHCLHWIQELNQNKAMANIRNMLKPGGKCYIILFSWSDMLPLQEQMTYHPKWKNYFKSVIQESNVQSKSLDVNKSEVAVERRRRRSSAPFPTFDAPPADERIRSWKQRMRDLVFEDIEVTLKKDQFQYDNWPAFQDMLKSLCHFLPYIPVLERDAFLIDYYHHVKTTYVRRQEHQDDSSPVTLNYEYIMIKGKKPHPHEK